MSPIVHMSQVVYINLKHKVPTSLHEEVSISSVYILFLAEHY
jgi:hypothetical protein